MPWAASGGRGLLEIQTSPQGYQQERAQKGLALLYQHSNSFRALCPSAQERSGGGFPTSRQIPKPQRAGTFPASPKAWSWGGDSEDMGTLALGTRLCSTAAATGTGDATPGAGSGCWGHFLGYLQFLLPDAHSPRAGALWVPSLAKQCHPVENTLLSSGAMDVPPSQPWSPSPGPLHGPDTANNIPIPSLCCHWSSPSPHCLPKTLQSCKGLVPWHSALIAQTD